MTHTPHLYARFLKWAMFSIALLGSALSLAAPGNFGGAFLPPTEAFRPSVAATDSNQIRIRFDIQPG